LFVVLKLFIDITFLLRCLLVYSFSSSALSAIGTVTRTPGLGNLMLVYIFPTHVEKKKLDISHFDRRTASFSK